MKSWKNVILFGVLLCGGCFVHDDPAKKVELAEEIVMSSPAEIARWNEQKYKFDATTGKITFTGKNLVIGSKKFLKVDPERPLVISGKFKNLSEKNKVVVYLGFKLYDENLEPLSEWSVKALPDTNTKLTRTCNEKMTLLYVEDATNWTEGIKGVPVFNVKEDYSDLPNPSVTMDTKQEIKKVTKLSASNYAVEFMQPIGCAFERGTTVRLHGRSGSLMYTGGIFMLHPGESRQAEGTVSGQAVFGAPVDRWWPGAVYAQPVVLLYPVDNANEATTEVDAISVRAAQL